MDGRVGGRKGGREEGWEGGRERKMKEGKDEGRKCTCSNNFHVTYVAINMTAKINYTNVVTARISEKVPSALISCDTSVCTAYCIPQCTPPFPRMATCHAGQDLLGIRHYVRAQCISKCYLYSNRIDH